MSIAQYALHDITKRYHDCVVLDRVGFSIKPGEKVGVIGDNGSGKSTLLKVLAGREQPDNGMLTVVAPGGIGYLAQTLELPLDATVQDAVDLALSDLRELEAAIHLAEAELAEHDADGPEPELSAVLRRYAGLVEQYQARGGYEADVRVEVALHGLGLPGLDRDRKLGTLSGASAPASHSRRPWPRHRSCCCSTSRPMTSTTGRWNGWRTTCGAIAAP